MSVTKVVMPKLSEAMETGKLIKWIKKEGDRVNGGDLLAEVETDKADVEMEAFGSGVLRKILVREGDTVPVGSLIAVIAEPSDDIAAQSGVDLKLVSGTGPGGRVVRKDVEAASVGGAGATGGAGSRAVATPAPAQLGPEYEDQPLSPMRAIIAKRMPMSKAPVPH